MLFKKGIVRKTFLFSALLIVLVISISFAAMYFIMPGYYLTQKEKNLQDNLNVLTGSLQAAQTEEACAALISGFSAANNVMVLSFSENDTLLPSLSTPFLGLRGDGGVGFFSETARTEADGRQTYMIRVMLDNVLTRQTKSGTAPEENISMVWATTEMSADSAISLENAVGTDIVDHVIVSGTLQPIDEAREVILSLIPYVLAIAIIAGLVLSGIFARQISKPILKISDAALRMQQMEPDVKSDVKTRDELGQLSANLDVLYKKLLENIENLKNEMDMVNRLERSKTELMQSASHELKTPIAALGGMLEGMMDNVGVYKNTEKYLSECKGQVDKLSHLVAEILGASKSDLADGELSLSEVYADELLDRAIAENIYQIHEKGLLVDLDAPPAPIVTDSDIFYRAISNLISNAVRYTPRGGTIRISITGEVPERRLEIENQCDFIPFGEIPKLFEPFYTRSYSRDKTKSGTGLGLYIVKRSLDRLEIPYEASSAELGFLISLTI